MVFTVNLVKHIQLNFIYMYFIHILLGIFAILSICLQITVSLYRLFIACNKNTHFLKIKLNIIISSLIIFSAVFYSPQLQLRILVQIKPFILIQW